MDWFIGETEDVLKNWDGSIYCKTVPGELGYRVLTKPLPCGNGFIPKGYKWNGAGAFVENKGIIAKIKNFFAWGISKLFPRWRHPIASCRHDWRCEHAKTKQQRLASDKLFKKDVAVGSRFYEPILGYVGVRLGAIIGVGTNYEN